MSLTLGENQLAKLTNETPEIRMRALEQIETRFIRCLQHDEKIKFKPVLLLKQLIRWFRFTPPTATERVLSLMLELLRSNYGNAIVTKIPAHRLLTELGKIHNILGDVPSKRAVELLDELINRIAVMYNDTSPDDSSLSSGEIRCNKIEGDLFSTENFRLMSSDYEAAWTRVSENDLATMNIIVDSLTTVAKKDLMDNLTALQVKLCDYPVECLLQSPDIFLQLLRIQQMHFDEVLLYINRVLFTVVKQLRQRVSIRSKTFIYSTSIEADEASLPQQLRVPKALSMLLYSCMQKLEPPLYENCGNNWHCIQLIAETIDAFGQLAVPIPRHNVQQLGIRVPKLVIYLNSCEVATAAEMANFTQEMMVPRLESLIFHDILMTVIHMNLKHDPNLDKLMARSMLKPIITDVTYLQCFSTAMYELCNLCCSLQAEADIRSEEMIRLKISYGKAVNLLQQPKIIPPMQLLQSQQSVCLVVVQMGSETLLKLLVNALVKCTSFYGVQRELRQEAESLLNTLFDFPDVTMQGFVLRLLKQPVVEHFHAFLNNTIYMTGCSNIELARNHILGLPMSSFLLRQLLVQGWLPHKSKQEQMQLQQWCIDYLIMLLGLSKLIDKSDFIEVFKMVQPVLPLMVCRAVNYPQLQQVIWDLIEPDKTYVQRNVSLRINACFLFHPDDKFRQEAKKRVAYILIRMDSQNKYMSNQALELNDHDLCVIRSPIDYSKLFSEPTTQSVNRSLQALQGLLQTPNLKTSIRKSTLVQLNVLLHNWYAVEAFASNEGSHMLCLEALHEPLLWKKNASAMDLQCLKPATSIVLRMLFCSEHFRREFKDNDVLLVSLLRCIYILPQDDQWRAELSCCIFQLLYQDHATPTELKLIMDVDLSPLKVPIGYHKAHAVPHTAAREGIALQAYLLAKHFRGDKALEAQHWRVFLAHVASKSMMDLQLSDVQHLDMADSLKLTPTDLALIQVTLWPVQLQKQLIEAGNCSSHKMLEQHVGSLQLFLVMMREELPQAEVDAMWQLMHKYLRILPGNDADLQVYQKMVDFCLSCLRHGVPGVQTGLSTELETDPHHSFYVILRDLHVNLSLLCLVTDCLVQLLRDQQHQTKCEWRAKLFMELSTLARSHFEQRQLQHVRCLLSVLRTLSESPLQMDDTKLQNLYQHFVQLSSNLRTLTQTGAQWQRDCLLIMCQLHVQAAKPSAVAISTGHGIKVLRYLLGLCSHVDGEVRTLAWVALGNWLKSSGSNVKNILLEFEDFLPGGLAASCLATMLAGQEQMLVRELGGRVFELLMPHIGPKACIEILRNYSFLQDAHAALGTLELSPNLSQTGPQSDVKNSCEIIGCFVSICIALVQLEPSWCSVLCDHAFVNALSDVMKLEMPPKPHNSAYLQLCAGQISKLYALCYVHNSEFLQRSICRDTVLIGSFIGLLGSLLDQKVVPETQLVHALKLIIVFCQDTNAYNFIYAKFKKYPELVLDLITYGLNHLLINRSVQQYTLDMLLLLLTKTQMEKEDDNLLRVLETFVEECDCECNKECAGISDTESTSDMEINSNCLTIKNCKNLSSEDPNELCNAAVLLYHNLDQLFDLHYPKTYNFLQPATSSHVQICEVLAILLKQSQMIVSVAIKKQLWQRVFFLLEAFLDDPNAGNATVYVRRMGAHKTQDIINNLLILFNLLIYWHVSIVTMFTEPAVATRVINVLLRLWPWLSHSGLLKYVTIRLASLLTEYSLEMCKKTSQVLPNQSHSLLQLMVRVADHETTKKETLFSKSHAILPSNPDSIVDVAIRVMINCCSCAEGRASLAKMRVLDIFDTILPATNSNKHKVKLEFLICWLSFWEIFSRYDPGYKVCHMTALLDTVRLSKPLSQKRRCCLRVMRNMCFGTGNRAQLIGMTAFMDLLREILWQPVQVAGDGGGDASLKSYEEHDLVVLCLWKLFGFTAKHRALLRGSKMWKQVSILWDQLSSFQSESPERFKTFPFAEQLVEKLTNLFKAVQT